MTSSVTNYGTSHVQAQDPTAKSGQLKEHTIVVFAKKLP
jgi:hypothetical protein